LSFSLACSSGGLFNRVQEDNVPVEILKNFSMTKVAATELMLINYELKTDVSSISLKIYNPKGDFIQTLENLPNKKTAGLITAFTWNLLDFEGKKVPTGIYLAKLLVNTGETEFKSTKNVVVSR